MYREELFFELKKTWEKFYRDCGGNVNPFIFAISNREGSYFFITDDEDLKKKRICLTESSLYDYFRSEDCKELLFSNDSKNKNVIYYGKSIERLINIDTWAEWESFPLPFTTASNTMEDDSFKQFEDNPFALCADIKIRMQHIQSFRNLLTNLKLKKNKKDWYIDICDMNVCHETAGYFPKFDQLCIEILHNIAEKELNADRFLNHAEREKYFYTDEHLDYKFFIGLYHYHGVKKGEETKENKSRLVCKHETEYLNLVKIQEYRKKRFKNNLPSFDLSCSSKDYLAGFKNNNINAFGIYSEGFVYPQYHFLFIIKIFLITGLSSDEKISNLLSKMRNYILLIIRDEINPFEVDNVLYDQLLAIKGEY